MARRDRPFLLTREPADKVRRKREHKAEVQRGKARKRSLDLLEKSRSAGGFVPEAGEEWPSWLNDEPGSWKSADRDHRLSVFRAMGELEEFIGLEARHAVVVALNRADWARRHGSAAEAETAHRTFRGVYIEALMAASAAKRAHSEVSQPAWWHRSRRLAQEDYENDPNSSFGW